MFYGSPDRMLASMSEIDPHAETPLMDWSELDVSGLLPTGTHVYTKLGLTSRAARPRGGSSRLTRGAAGANPLAR
jgi:hypothetical protein